VVVNRSATDAIERDVPHGAACWINDLAGELDADVLDDPAAVVRIGAAERDAHEIFCEALAARAVDRRVTVNGEPAPVAVGVALPWPPSRCSLLVMMIGCDEVPLA
jgi:hypothetical protein